MAEAVVGALVGQLASLAGDSVANGVSLVKNVDKDVETLTRNLRAIQAVLEDAEKKQLANQSVKNWLANLKEVSFEMDNVLDEWNTALHKLKIQKESGEDVDDDHHLASAPKKMRFSIPWPFTYFSGKLNQITLPGDIALKIKDLNQKLAEIASEKDQYNLSMTTTEKPLVRPNTTCLVDETEVEGRDADKEVLMSKLLCENSAQQDQFHTIPIVGMGGLGKTTLAQFAFKDERVIAHFDLRIWVCVSDPFEEITVAKAIIEGVEGSSPTINELQGLSQRIVKCIEGKKFLLILDDVWTEDSKKWDPFKLALKCGSIGSRVVVTTRKEGVAKMMGATNHMIRLEKLSEEHCWLVFKRLAFSTKSEEECKELEEIGRKIASKGKGVPLVARSLGSLCQETETEWEDVFSSELWTLENVEETFAPFLVSYYDLPSKEKLCFCYCAIFPKDYKIKRDRLIEMWMSQKYFGDAPEDEGRKCFDNLARRSFFQNFERDGMDGSITSCKMHDIMHDFAQFLTENEFLVVMPENLGKEMLKPSSKKARHLTIMTEYGKEFGTVEFSKFNKTTLQTLFIETNVINPHLKSILDLTCLRSLTLSYCGIRELPDTVGGLIHLRYLNLSDNGDIEELPETLCELCNLQTLNLSSCWNLRRIPEGVGKLVNLRHLYVDGWWNFEGFPKGLVKLTNLRSLTLDRLNAVEDKEAYFDIRNLEKFDNLQLRGRIEINECRNLRSKDEAEKVGLKNISRCVVRLVLNFGRSSSEGIVEESDSTVLEGLEPHQNLQKLVIFNYMATTLSPTWIPCLNNLRNIRVWSCDKCKELPCLGNMPSLQSIMFGEMSSVEKVGLEFLGITESSTSPATIFPRLKFLSFFRMPQWKKWEGKIENHVIRIMPSLEVLWIRDCEGLQVLPGFLETTTSLKTVNIYPKDSFEKLVKIFHSPHFQLSSDLKRDEFE